MTERKGLLQREHPTSQTVILSEAANRVRRYAGLAQNDRHKRPLFVVVTKFDSWKGLLNQPELPRPLVRTNHLPMAALDGGTVKHVSSVVRKLLWRLCPEIVSVAEGFAQHVTYVPASATGCAPEVDADSGALGFRPRVVNPVWAEVPLVCALSQGLDRLVRTVERRKPETPGEGTDVSGNGKHVSDTPNAEAT